MKKKIKEYYKKLVFSLSGQRGRTRILRSYGMKIGENCLINTHQVSTEPYLIEIGDHVAISSGTELITHDGSAWVFRKQRPELDIFGKIKIGDNTFIGSRCIILPNTIIGKNCILGAGSVIRGKFPDNSVIIGNPAKAVLKTAIMEKLSMININALMTKKMKTHQKHEFIKKHFKLTDS